MVQTIDKRTIMGIRTVRLFPYSVYSVCTLCILSIYSICTLYSAFCASFPVYLSTYPLHTQPLQFHQIVPK